MSDLENRSEAYWNSYRLLEKQLIELSHSICFDDNQINVYSSELADIINSACIKIESLAKDIYEEHIYPFQLDSNAIPLTIQNDNRRNKSKFRIEKWGRKDWHFDYNCLVEIDLKYALSKKVVRLKSERFHFKKYQNRLLPFGNITLSDCNGGKWESCEHYVFDSPSNIFDDINWCKSYQAIKHNYIQSIPEHGTIKNAIMVMAAYYLLSIYLLHLPSKIIFDRSLDNMELDFGSELFSCQIGYSTPPFIVDSEWIGILEKESRAQEKTLMKDYYLQKKVFDDPASFPFVVIIKEYYYTSIEAQVKNYCNINGIEKYDIAPHKNEKAVRDMNSGDILYHNIKEYINSRYNPSIFCITLNTSANIYDNCYIRGYEYEKSKYSQRNKKALASISVGDYIDVNLVFNNVFINCKVEKIDDKSITIAVRNRRSKEIQYISYSFPIQNIIHISKHKQTS